MDKKKRVAIVGTNGIPAKYGGFETLTENITKHLNDKFDFIVYCSNKQKTGLKEYNNSKLINLPFNANGWQSLIYDTISLFHAAIKSDVILYLGPGAGFILPLIKLFRKKIIVNFGGLNEWEREKFSNLQRFVIKKGYYFACKSADYSISDNNILRESILKNFNTNSFVIKYGGDNANKININDELLNKYPFLNSKYFVNVSRAQVDNNLHLVLNAFRNLPNYHLVMVSNWSISTYGINLKNEFKDIYNNITILDAIYDIVELNAIRSNASIYIHSHSYCGTAPSLVEAMSLSLPIFSFDVPTNRETTSEKAKYFKSSEDLIELINNIDSIDLTVIGNLMKEIAEENYTWKYIASEYSKLFEK